MHLPFTLICQERSRRSPSMFRCTIDLFTSSKPAAIIVASDGRPWNDGNIDPWVEGLAGSPRSKSEARSQRGVNLSNTRDRLTRESLLDDRVGAKCILCSGNS